MKKNGIFAVLAGLLLLCACLSLCLGSVQLTAGQLWGVVTGKTGVETARTIVVMLRLPRLLAAMLAGCGLGAAGLMLQTVTGNGLCAPNVIGINAGAGFFVLLLLCLFPMAYAFLPLAAFAGALLTTCLVLSLSFAGGRGTVRTDVVLAGVAVSAILNASISFLSLRYPDALSSYTSFAAGGVAGVQTQSLMVPAICIALALLSCFLLCPGAERLCLGDEAAHSLGVPVKAVRFCCLLAVSALCAAVVSFAGLMGFVGLVVPHMARRLVSGGMKKRLLASCLMGAVLVTLADMLGRTIFAPAELPAGLLLSAIGAPFFLYLLVGRRGNHADI